MCSLWLITWHTLLANTDRSEQPGSRVQDAVLTANGGKVILHLSDHMVKARGVKGEDRLQDQVSGVGEVRVLGLLSH